MGLAVCSEGLLLDKKGAIMPRLCRESGRVPGAVKVGRNAGHPRDSDNRRCYDTPWHKSIRTARRILSSRTTRSNDAVRLYVRVHLGDKP